MKKMNASPKRLLLVIAGSLVLLVAGLLIFFPVGRVKTLAASRASAALGREVAIDDARLVLAGLRAGRLTATLRDVRVTGLVLRSIPPTAPAPEGTV